MNLVVYVLAALIALGAGSAAGASAKGGVGGGGFAVYDATIPTGG